MTYNGGRFVIPSAADADLWREQMAAKIYPNLPVCVRNALFKEARDKEFEDRLIEEASKPIITATYANPSQTTTYNGPIDGTFGSNVTYTWTGRVQDNAAHRRGLSH